MAATLAPCPACGTSFRQDELNNHMATCKAAREIFGSPAPSTRAKSGGGNGKRSSRSGQPQAKPVAEPPPMSIAEPNEDGRVQCAICKRAFAADRIVKHQFICATSGAGPAKKPAEVGERVRSVVEAAVAAAVHRGGRGGRGRAPPPKPPSKWRQASEELQATMRAARAHTREPQARSGGARPGGPPSRRPASSPYSSPALTAERQKALAEQKQRTNERLAELDEVKEFLSQEEYAAKREQIEAGSALGSARGNGSSGGNGNGGGGGGGGVPASRTTRTPPPRAQAPPVPRRPATMRPARPASPTKAQRAHAAEIAALEERNGGSSGGGGGRPSHARAR